MNTNEKLKGITKGFANDYKLLCEISRDERIKEMRPGDPIPKAGILYGDEAKNTFETKAEGYRAKANYIIDNAMKDINSKLTEAPSEEAVRSIQLFAMRDNVSMDDLGKMIDAYGSNVQAYDTLRNLGTQKGLPVNVVYAEHPIRERIKDIEAVRSDINGNINIYKAERGYTSDGFIALLDMEIDRAFDPEAEE